MPVSQKPGETGWFYHAPARKVVMEKVDAPAPSQIPGIGFDDPSDAQKEEVREMMFKETDSDYIRLAKMGGRKDLLSFDPSKFKFKHKLGQGHSRSDWYYLEDNRIEDEEKKEAEKKEWEFLLPEYMVHQGYKPSFSNPATPPTRGSNSANAPYYTEKEATEDVDRFASRIPEPRKEGYGIRNQRAPPKVQPLPPREKPTNGSALRNKAKPQFGMPSENEAPTNMMKLLAGEYEREWHKAHEDFETTSKSNPKQAAAGAESGSAKLSASNRQRMDAEAAISAAALRRKAREQEEKDLFKLQRFKNVPSKIDSHQRPEIMASNK